MEDYRWLVGAEAAEWLARLADSTDSLVSRTRLLRRSLSAGRVHLLLEQCELRRRAGGKFSAAQRMFFTPRGLEQATDQWVARCKASRFHAGQSIADLCCGIGGDLVGLAGKGRAVAVDMNPVHALLATANCTALGLELESTVIADAADVPLRCFDAWHIDPDRRPAGRRTIQLEWSAPPLAAMQHMLQVVPDAAVKLAPASETPERWSDLAERQWIGSGRECRQQVAWFGRLADHPGRRSVVVVNHHGETSQTLVGSAGTAVDEAPQVRRFVYEPHAAVLAAGLTGTLAQLWRVSTVNRKVAYLTGDQPIQDLRLSTFEVTDVLPLDAKRLRDVLRARRIGQLEVKKRGVTIDPEAIRRKLQVRGDHSATLLITPLGSSVRNSRAAAVRG